MREWWVSRETFFQLLSSTRNVWFISMLSVRSMTSCSTSMISLISILRARKSVFLDVSELNEISNYVYAKYSHSTKLALNTCMYMPVYVAVSLYFVYLCMYMRLWASTFHAKSLDLYIFTGSYAYSPKMHIYRNINLSSP